MPAVLLALACAIALAYAATASAAPPAIALGFATPTPGTVVDDDGEGTGFTGILANSAGDQYLASNLDRTGGELRVTSTAGDVNAAANTQQNALFRTFDGASPYAVGASLVGPLGLSGGAQSAGIFIGPDQQNIVKLVAGRSTGGVYRVQLAKEQGGVFSQQAVSLPALQTASRIDLTLEVDPASGGVTGRYSLNGGAAGTLSTTLPGLGTVADKGGVITTNAGTTQPIVARYDAFLVEPVSILAFNSPVAIHNFSAIPGGPQNGLQFPTSITIGPDGRLYAAAQYGRIHVLNLNGDNDVTGVQGVIDEIFNTQNQTFDGSNKAQQGRQITGIAFDPASTASNQVLYVSHSDPEIFEEAEPGESTVYPASGRVTKLTLNGAGAVVAQQNLVVGLPRSGENHSPNGLAFKDGWLYLAIGGNTNAGGLSKPFGFFPETPLSASIVRINPGAIGGGTVDVTSTSTFGFNASGQVTGLSTTVPNVAGQFEMWATGFRNPYDLLWHSNGSLYTAENERNEGFGNGPDANTAPTGTCPNPGVAADTPPDRLFKVAQGGYHGHPNPSRGECALRNTNGSVPGGGVAPIGDFQKNSSTTGITEYTADTTGPLLKGQILATSYANVSGGNKLQRVKLNAAGTGVIEKADVATNMSAPIDVTVAANGDILVAEHNRFAVGGPGAPSGRISRIRPIPTSGLGCSPLGPQADSDGDGYSDMDEIDNATSRCNPADRPPDFDGDGLSDLNDPDGDGDGVLDTQDQWQRDPANGTNTPLPFNLAFNTPQGGGWFGSGFGGIQLSSNGGGPLAGRISAGGAGGFLSLTATGGTADGAANNQHNALQQGFDARNPFTSSISVVEPFSVTGPQGNAAASLFFGPGESDFVRVGVASNGGGPVIELHREVGGAPARTAAAPLGLPVSAVRLFLEGRPASNQVIAYYKLGTGAVTQLGVVDVPAGWFSLPASTGVMTTGAGAPDPNIAFILDEFSITTEAPGGGEPPPSGSGAYLSDSGTVVMEAEHADEVVARSGAAWEPGGPTGSVGSAMSALPDAGQGWGALPGATTTAPELRFLVDFDQAGTYNVWLRANSPDTAGNSVHVGINGQVTSTSDAITSSTFGAWAWYSWGSGGPNPATVTVPTAGLHTVSVWAREDGISLDRLVLSTSATAPTGEGPAESSRASSGPADTTAPTLADRSPAADATAVAVGANVVATFDEAIDPATLTASSFTLAPTAGGAAVAATRGLTSGGTVATLNPAADLAPGTAYTATLTTAITDTAGNALAGPVSWDFTTAPAAPPPGGSGAYLSQSGQVVVEAEAGASTARSGHDWTGGSSPSGFVGSALQAGPDSGQGWGPTEVGQSPQLDIPIDFGSAGTWYLWGRVLSPNTAGNSLHIGLDGQQQGGSAYLNQYSYNSWAWVNSRINGPTARIEVPSAGVHSLSLWAREDGIHIDRLVLTTDPNYAPSGTGPAESARDGGTTPPPPGDTTPPAVGDRSPAADATAVAVGANVVATFDEAIDPATLTGSSFTLAPTAGGAAVAATRGLTSGGTVATLNPAADLAPGTAYTATLTTAITDTAGNALAGPVSWGFTTAPAAPPPGGDASATLSLIDPVATRDMGHSSTYTSGTFRLANTGDVDLTGLRIDVGTAVLTDLVFDPADGTPAGDDVGRDLTVDASSDVPQGDVIVAYSDPQDDGYRVVDATIAGMGAGDQLVFGIDVDPTSTRGSSGTSGAVTPPAAHVSGAELHGATVTVEFADGRARATHISLMPQSQAGTNWERAARASLAGGEPPAPTIARQGAAASPAVVTDASQSVVVTGPPSTSGVVVVTEGHLNVAKVPNGGFDLDPFEANTATRYTEVPFTTDAQGIANVAVTLTATDPHPDFPAPEDAPREVGINLITAHMVAGGTAGPVSAPVVLQLGTTPPDTTAPTLADRSPAADATAVAVGANVVATFDEAIDPATLTGSSFTLAPTAGGAAVAATRGLTSGGTVATLNPAADLAPGTAYTATLTTAITDTAGNALAGPVSWDFTTAPAAPPPGGSGAYLSQSGQVVVEAEAGASTARSGHDWTGGSSPSGFVGSALQAGPDSGQGWGPTEVGQSPQLDIPIDFGSAGTWYLWGRVLSPNTAGNSLHIGLDGQQQGGSAYLNQYSYNSWAWVNSRINGPTARIEVPSAGVHSLSLWAREDGIHIDRLVLTTDPNYAPSGTGPAESARDGGTTPPPPGDTTPPAVGDRSPAADATAVAVGANVVATFDEAIDPATLTASSFTLAPTAGGAAVAATRGLTSGGTVATLNPAADLAPGTAYTATLTTAITDTAGNALAGPVSWGFTTAPAAPPPGGSGAYLSQSGQVVVEAEAGASTARSGHDWAPAGDGGWTTVAPSPIPRYEGQGAAVNGLLYALGGYDTCCAPAVTRSSHAYDPATDAWTAITDLPSGVTHAGTAVLGDRIVLAGGFLGDSPGAATDEVWSYDTTSDTWERGVDLPAPRGGGALVRLGTDLHFFGGGGPGGGHLIEQDYGDHWVLADGSNAWVERAPMPNPRNHLAGVALDGRIYAIGGQHLHDEATGNQNGVDVYDPATDTWAPGPSLPQPLGHISSSTFVRDGRIVVVGGKTQGQTLVDAVIELDPQAGVWTQRTPIPRAAQSPLAVTIDGSIVVAGGGGGGLISADAYVLNSPWSSSGVQIPAGYVGSALQASPDSGQGWGPTEVGQSPQLDIPIDFGSAGTWYLWARGFSPGTAGNSLHVGLDGQQQGGSAFLNQYAYGSWQWFNSRQGGPTARIEVPSAGVHTLTVWAREDGFNLDRLVLTTDAGFTPTGTGPAESPRGSG